MKNGNRWTQACLALLVNACLGTPSTAQGLAAQSAKIAELERAGKYAEAIPLAQAMLANREKGPHSRDLAGALNNLTQPYGDVGRDADAELLHKRALAIMEKAVEPAAETARQVQALLSDDEALLLFAIAEQELMSLRWRGRALIGNGYRLARKPCIPWRTRRQPRQRCLRQVRNVRSCARQ
jgi:hypothetical protein